MDYRKTTIAISLDTKQMLLDLGSMDDSFDDVIKRLIRSHNICTCVTSQGGSSGGAGLSYDEADK